jgi:hypothetical protein
MMCWPEASGHSQTADSGALKVTGSAQYPSSAVSRHTPVYCLPFIGLIAIKGVLSSLARWILIGVSRISNLMS